MKNLILMCSIVLIGFSMMGCGQVSASANENDSSESHDAVKSEAIKALLLENLSGEVTVSCFETMFYKDLLEKAAKTFEAQNPGTKIHIETFASMPVVKTLEDGITITTMENVEAERTSYINKINTELMSGQGADLLAMDVLPSNKYADANQLEDLQFYMDEDSAFDISKYRKNIIDAVKFRKGQYLMPLDYNFDYIAFDTSRFTEAEQQSLRNKSQYTYDQLIEDGVIPFNRNNANANANATVTAKMFQRTAGIQTFFELFDSAYETYIDIENKRVTLTDGRFSNLLEQVKSYGDKGYLKPDSASASTLASESESTEFSMDDFVKIQSEPFFYKIKPSFSLLSDTIKELKLKSYNVFSIGLGDETYDEILGLLSNDSGNVNLSYTQAFGINSNSENKALAWAFLKFLMSDEMQSDQGMYSSGLPINNTARMEKAKLNILAMTSEDETFDLNTPLNEMQQEVYEHYTNYIETFSDALNVAHLKDDTIDTMISNEISNYFSQAKTADEVAKILQSKIELYLNE